MRERNYIAIDFDGTLTDSVKGFEEYRGAYLTTLAPKIGMTTEGIEDSLSAASRIGGHDYSNPYRQMFTSISTMFRELKIQDKSVLRHIQEAVYPQMHPHFKEDAKDFLDEIQTKNAIKIVTNSNGGHVKEKLNILLPGNTIAVIGDAQKHVVDDAWEDVKATFHPRGFPEPVRLRRKHYHDHLLNAGNPEAVIGDTYELDLALPEAKGIHTIFVASSFTPQWELDHYERHPNGRKAATLTEIYKAII